MRGYMERTQSTPHLTLSPCTVLLTGAAASATAALPGITLA